MQIYRVTNHGKRWAPTLEGGWYVPGDPRKGYRKHLAENAVRVRTEVEAIELVKKGYSLRVETPTRPSLIRRGLYVDDQPLG